jgi:serine/threonine-protein kinase
MVADKILQADQLVAERPSESILLYNAAREWSVDENSESELVDRVERINAMIHNTGDAADSRPDRTAVLSAGAKKQAYAVVADRYRIKRQLGSGAMGIVYLAEDTRLKRDVALKQLAPQHSADDQLLARFRQEALALARLSHPNIVQVYDLVEGQGFLWIAMEFVVGRDLEEKLEGSQRLALDEIARLAKQMAAALGYAHDRGVVHRDFKPANVLVTVDGDVKITDFGIAKLSQSSLHTQMNTVMGSPAYMSPEQANGDGTDQRTDVYALGVVLYQMICGELPFSGDARSIISQHLTKTPPSLRDRQEAVPKELDDIVQKMLAKDPAKRYQSMDEVVAQLDGQFE